MGCYALMILFLVPMAQCARIRQKRHFNTSSGDAELVERLLKLDIDRFLRTQDHHFGSEAVSIGISIATQTYETALSEIRDNGHKQGHWRWYIIPNEDKHSGSRTGQFFGLRSREELRLFIKHDVLGPRLVEMYANLMTQVQTFPGGSQFEDRSFDNPIREIFDGARMKYFLQGENFQKEYDELCKTDDACQGDFKSHTVDQRKAYLLSKAWSTSRFLGDAKNFAANLALFTMETRVWLQEGSLQGKMKQRVEYLNLLAYSMHKMGEEEGLSAPAYVSKDLWRAEPHNVASILKVMEKRKAMLDDIAKGGEYLSVPGPSEPQDAWRFLVGGDEGVWSDMRAHGFDTEGPFPQSKYYVELEEAIQVARSQSAPEVSIPIRFVPCGNLTDGLPMTSKFDASACPESGSVVIHAETVAIGSVFDHPHCDDTISVVGGTAELLPDEDGEGWSGDMSTGTFAITHDGNSTEIVVTFSTRYD